MSNKTQQLGKASSLLTQALGTALASMPNNRAVIEATGDIRRAIQKIDGVAKEQLNKRKMSQSQFETWWGNIQSGTANQSSAPMSQEACQRSLAQLDKMIVKEQSKIDNLETLAAQLDAKAPDQLLQD
jgi:hypothetical protein